MNEDVRCVEALLKACRDKHRDGFCSGAICICGAGGGKSAACRGLELLREGIEGTHQRRAEIAELFGWYVEPCRN